jgi:hypothetical protein
MTLVVARLHHRMDLLLGLAPPLTRRAQQHCYNHMVIMPHAELERVQCGMA